METQNSRLVIIGSGHAGYTLAREWRRLDAVTPLTILTRDDGASYYKPDLSKAFASGKDADGLVKADAPAMAKELNADIRTNVDVKRIVPQTRHVHWGDQVLPYSKLVLATGATPIRLALAGDAAETALSINDRQDYARLRARLKPGCRVLILGAGLIGCEFANDLAAAGFTVTVVDVAAWPLARFAPEVLGAALQNALSGLGVQWRLGTSVVALKRAAGDSIAAELADGSLLETDVVISAIGLRPNITLAQEAGIRCAGGIVVDQSMQTSAPGVFALGDCIEINGRPMPFILPIANGIRALAPTLAGTPTAAVFPAMPTPVKTPVCPTVVCPPNSSAGTWHIEGNAPDLTAMFHDASGAPVGFALTGKATAKRGELAARVTAALSAKPVLA